MATEDMSPDVDAETPAAENDHDETAAAAAPAEDPSFEAHDGGEEMDVEDEDEMDAEDGDQDLDAEDAHDDATPADEA